MDRREFLIAALGSAGSLALPAWAALNPEGAVRGPLVVHTVVVRPLRYFWEVGARLEFVDSPRGACLSVGDDTFGVGDALTV